MKHKVNAIAASLAALLLAGCQPGALAMLEPVEMRAQKEAPPGAPENTCWDRDESPAVIETVIEQVEVERSQTDANGRVTKPAIYRTETNQKIVKHREEAWFQTPCPEQMTPEFIASLQRALKARGHYSGADHGRMDRWTRGGIRAYQKPQGLDSATLSLAAAQQMGLAVVDLPDRAPDAEPEPEVAKDIASTTLTAMGDPDAEDEARKQQASRQAEADRIKEAQHLADEQARAALAEQAELYRKSEAARQEEAERIIEAQRLADDKARAELAEQAELFRQSEAARQAELEREAKLAAQAEAARQAELERQAASAAQAEAARRAEIRQQEAATREAQARKDKENRAAHASSSDRARREAELVQALEDEKRRIESTGRQTLPISTESY